MNILILGSGGREHALASAIKKSKHCDQLFIAPGNGGTGSVGINTNIDLKNFEAILDFSIRHQVKMIVVGPEEPLVNGFADCIERYNQQVALSEKIIVIGPAAAGAKLEGSKAFAKAFMQKHHIPTAAYSEFTVDQLEEGIQYIRQHTLPVVLKADGLAAGKGVVIAETHAEAESVFKAMLLDRQFGDAGNKVVIEAFLQGIEVSVFVLTNGKEYQVIGHAKDYKRIGEGDTGPNTGGMGAVTPVPFCDAVFMDKVEKQIIIPTIQGLQQDGIPYLGFIFFGLIKVGEEPWVIEYNCRMGDPETEVVIPRLKTDLVELLMHTASGTLQSVTVEWEQVAFATVVAVSGGYPGAYTTHLPISFKNQALPPNTCLFHAGTVEDKHQVLTRGGRVLAITSSANTIAQAVKASTQVLNGIHFEGMYYRKDIGYEFPD